MALISRILTEAEIRQDEVLHLKFEFSRQKVCTKCIECKLTNFGRHIKGCGGK